MARRSARIPLALGCVIAAAAVVAPAASAKVWFGDLAGRTFAPGDRVKSTIPGCPGNASCESTVRGLVVFVVRGGPTAAGALEVPPSPRWRVARIGKHGGISFALPTLRAGGYSLLVRADWSGTVRYLPASGEFSVAAARA